MAYNTNQVLVTFRMFDEASKTLKQIARETTTLSEQLTHAAAIGSMGFMQMNQAIQNSIGQYLGEKTPLEFSMDVVSKNESNKVLLKTMTDTEQSATNMYNVIDDATNKSLVSMQDMIPAMKAFKASAGATDEQMIAVADQVANFGSAVLATTGSTELANTAMFKLSHGIQGSYQALDQYGITEESLEATGLWNGRKNDVEGFMAAVTEVTGNTEELMNTNAGLDAQIQKSFSRGAKKIGEDFLPQLKSIKQAYLDLNESTNNDLAAGLLAATSAGEALSQALWNVSIAANGFRDIRAAMMVIASKSSRISKMVDGIGSAWGKVTDKIKQAMYTMTLSEKRHKSAEDNTKDGADSAKQSKSKSVGGGASAPSVNTPDVDVPDKSKKTKKSTDNVKKNNESLKGFNKCCMQYSGTTSETSDLIKKSSKTQDTMSKMDDVVDVLPDDLPDKASKSNSKITKTSGILAGVSASFTSMIVPLLSISAVIAVMIPVVAGLVAEALIFAAGIARLIKYLGFDDLDLSGAAKGIKSFGQSMWELSNAAAAMVATSFSSTLLTVFTRIGIGIQSIEEGARTVKKAVPIINDLASMSTIDPTVVTKLKDLGTALKGLSDALKGLGDTNWSIWTGGFLDKVIGEPISKMVQAHDTLYSAAEKLAIFKDLPSVDSSTATTLKNLGTAIKGISEALGSIGDINWDMSWGRLFGSFKPGAITKAYLILGNAAEELKKFNKFPQIDPIGDKVTRVADALKPIKAGIKATADIGKVEIPDTTVIYHISLIRQRLKGVADQINLMQRLPDVKEVGPKLKPIDDALKPLPDIAYNLGEVRTMDIPDSAVTYVITELRQRLKGVADQINMIQLLPDVTPVGDKIRNIVDGLKQFPQAANTMGVVNGLVVPPSSITYTLTQLRQRLKGVAEQINLVQRLPAVTPIGNKITPIIDGLKPLNDANQILTITNSIMVPPASVATVIQDLRQRLAGVAKQLNLIAKIEKVHGAVDPVNKVITGLKPLATAATAMVAVPYVGADVEQRVSRAVQAIKNIAAELNKLSGTGVANVSGIASKIKEALNEIHGALGAAATNVVQPARNIGATIANGIRYGMSPLYSFIVSGITNAFNGGIGPAIAGGRMLGTYATDGFRFKLDFKGAVTAEMNDTINAMRSRTNDLVNAARDVGAAAADAFSSEGMGRASPGYMAREMAAEMNDINAAIWAGKANLIRSVRKVGTAMTHAWSAPDLSVGMSVDQNTSMPRVMNDLSKSNSAMRLTHPGGGGPIKTDNSTSTHNISINEGAIKLDARNLTTKESKQVMINALEGLDVLRNPQIKGL